jgi:hypothetical protein
MGGNQAAMNAKKDNPAPPPIPEPKQKKTRGGFYGAGTSAASGIGDSSRRSTFLGG